METRIQSLHFTANPELTAYVSEKVGHLEHLDKGKILSADVCLKLDNSSTGDNKVCEIRLHVPGNDFFAKSQSHSFEVATNHVVEALQHQIAKRKASQN